MWRVLALLLLQGSLQVIFGRTCIEQTLKCAHRRIPFSYRKNLPETVEALQKACKAQDSYYNCLIDVEKTLPKPEGAVAEEKANRIESEYTLHELCTDGYKLRASYFKHVDCMNQQQTDICTSPNFISILMSKEKSTSECSIQNKVTTCIAMMMAVNCGSESEFIYRKLVHIANDGDVHCHSGEDIGDILSKINQMEKNKNDQILRRIGELVNDSCEENGVGAEDLSRDGLKAANLESKLDLEVSSEGKNSKSDTESTTFVLNQTSSFTFNQNLRVTALDDGTINIQWLEIGFEPNISLSCSDTRNESGVRFDCTINRKKTKITHDLKEMEQTRSSDTEQELFSNKLPLKDAEIHVQNRIKGIRNKINEIKKSIGTIKNSLEHHIFKDIELLMNDITAAREVYDESKILNDVSGSSEMEEILDEFIMNQSSQDEKMSEHVTEYKMINEPFSKLNDFSEQSVEDLTFQNLEEFEYLTIERPSVYDEKPHNFIKLKPRISLEQASRDVYKTATNIAHDTEYMLSDSEYMVYSEKSKAHEDPKDVKFSTIIGAVLDEVAENSKMFEYVESSDPHVMNIIDSKSEYAHDSVENNPVGETVLEFKSVEQKQVIDKFENDQCALDTCDELESIHVLNVDSNNIYKGVDTTNRSSENYYTLFTATNEDEHGDKFVDESNMQNNVEVNINVVKTPLEDNSGYSTYNIAELNEVMGNDARFDENIDGIVYAPLTGDSMVTETSVMTAIASESHIGDSMPNTYAVSTTETSVAYDFEDSNPSLLVEDYGGTTRKTYVKGDTVTEELTSQSHASAPKKLISSDSDENFPERIKDSEDHNEMGVDDVTENLHPACTNDYTINSKDDGPENFKIMQCSTNSDSVCNSEGCSTENERVAFAEDSKWVNRFYSHEDPTLTSIEHLSDETERSYKEGIYEKIVEFAKNV